MKNIDAPRHGVNAWHNLDEYQRAENQLHESLARLRATKLDKVAEVLDRESFILHQLISQELLNYPQVYGHLLNATADLPGHRAVVEQRCPPPFVPPTVTKAAKFRAKEAPPRQWLVDGWIPAHDVTLIGADGGTGKTTVGLQLHHAMETQGMWIGMQVAEGASLYVTAEEPEGEMHFRYRQAAARSCNQAQHELDIISLADYEDAVLVQLVDGKPQATELLGWLERRAAAKGYKLLTFDAVADFCAINEMDRTQVRRTVAIFRAMAIRLQCAVILMAHPSVDGMKTKRGYSGSTHWNNAVRSRMYFTTPDAKEGEIVDPDLRRLELSKANRARKGQAISLRWVEGVFLVEEGATCESMSPAEVRNQFLHMLQEHTKNHVVVSANPGRNFAPMQFEKHADAKNVKSAAFRRAMDELMKAGTVQNISERHNGRERTRLIVSDWVQL